MLLERLMGKKVYICGMKAMVEDSKKILIEELGFDEKMIHVERW
jgi:NAD(P)H-flavin reductase